MVISNNRKPAYDEFADLVHRTNDALNADAQARNAYYLDRNGTLLEEDVCRIMTELAQGTAFEGTIVLKSGHIFPDIIAGRYYGDEVKSTKRDSWESTGSSILETTRPEDVERIFLTFGRLYTPVEFKSRPYEEVMSSIAVTHAPRYKIDMDLEPGKTVFDQIGIKYDDLRKLKNPAQKVADYYRAHLTDGESLWWSGNDTDETVPLTVRLWDLIPKEERDKYLISGFVRFPEMMAQKKNAVYGKKKYNRFVLWLATQGVVNSHVRDSFSAGGQVIVKWNTQSICMPAAFKNVYELRNGIKEEILSLDEDELKNTWGVNELEESHIKQWCELVANVASNGIPASQIFEVMDAMMNGTEMEISRAALQNCN